MAERHFIVYDLEATCWRHRRSWQVEVIEIGAVKVSENLEVLDEFTAFVRPLLHPEISEFCTRLTSITQADIEDADAFHEVIQAFESWMEPASVRTVWSTSRPSTSAHRRPPASQPLTPTMTSVPPMAPWSTAD